jgi:2-methylisocitrate lyase-like PEP mutase family enzyme
MQISSRTNFRTRLNTGEPIIVPCAYDTLSALLIEEAGFEAALLSGFGLSASLLGMPDMEFYTGVEMSTACRNVCRRLDIPVMADADNGYGNALNVMRTVADLEQAGVASLTLEDQKSPKACPLLSEQQRDLISVDEAVGKLKAAASVRRDPDLVIVARTDARDEEEVLRRARAYADAGADMIKITSHALRSLDFLEALRTACSRPIMIASIGWATTIEADRFRGLAAVITHPLMPLLTTAAALAANLRALRGGVKQNELPSPLMSLEKMESVLGLETFRQAESLYLPNPQAT